MKLLLTLLCGALGYAGTIGTSAVFRSACADVTSEGTERAAVQGACDQRPGGDFPGTYLFNYAVSAEAARGDLSVASGISSYLWETGGTTASAWFEDMLTVTAQTDQEVFLSYDVLYTGRHSVHPDGRSLVGSGFGGTGVGLNHLFMGTSYDEGVLVTIDDPIAVQTNREFLFRGELNLQTQGSMPQASVRAQLVGIRAKDREGNEVPITVQWAADSAQVPEPASVFTTIGGIACVFYCRVRERPAQRKQRVQNDSIKRQASGRRSRQCSCCRLMRPSMCSMPEGRLGEIDDHSSILPLRH